MWLYDCVADVVMGNLRLVSVYQPMWGSNEEAMERCRRDLESLVGMGGRERLVIGATLTQMWRKTDHCGVSRSYGLWRTNEEGWNLIE